MTLKEIPSDLTLLRDENDLSFARLRAGHVEVATLLATAEALGDSVLLAECLITEAHRSEMANEVTLRSELMKRLEALLEPEVRAELRPLMRWALALVRAASLFGAGEYEESLKSARRARMLAGRTGYQDAQASTLNMLGVLAYRMESFDRAIEFFTRSLSEDGTQRSLAIAHTHLATVFESQGELELALSHREVALGALVGEEISDYFRFECDYCSTLILLGRFDQAREHAGRIDQTRPDAVAFVRMIQAEGALAEGQEDAAYTFAVEAAALFEELELVAYRRMAVEVQGEVLLRWGRYEDVIALVGEGLPPADTIGHLKGCEQLVEAYRQLGQWEEVVHYQELLRNHMELRQVDLHTFHQLQEKSMHFGDLEAKNRALDERNQEFELLRSDRETLLSVVSHELRSPLTALGLVLHSIEERVSHGLNFEDRIRTGSQMVRRLQGITNQVATVGELTSGGLELELSVVDLDQVISRVVDEQRFPASRKTIEILAPDSGLLVLANRGRLEQVLTNLVSNAIKFSNSGTLVTIRTRTEGSRVEVQVEDQGPGLTAPDMARLFRRHATLSARPTGGESSSGLGLFIAKQLSLAMGGDIVANSDGPGHGSTFSVLLSRSSDRAQR